jgi:hypothetical protein
MARSPRLNAYLATTARNSSQILWIDNPPPHDAVNGQDRAGAMPIVQTRRLSGRLAIDQTGQPMCVELEHRIVNNMKRQAANLRRLGARRRFTPDEVQEIHGGCRNLRRGGAAPGFVRSSRAALTGVVVLPEGAVPARTRASETAPHIGDFPSIRFATSPGPSQFVHRARCTGQIPRYRQHHRAIDSASRF